MAKTQSVDAPSTACATFLVYSLSQASDALTTARATVASVGDLIKNVGFRDPTALLTCTVGVGSDIWDQLTGKPKPSELHPFPAVHGAAHTAISTPGDLFFHIRSKRQDFCFEFERQLINRLGSSVKLADRTTGFRYMDMRDLLGFVDGTANPTGNDVEPSVFVGEENAPVAGGSYVVVQKYLHDMQRWNSLTTSQQETIIGRTKSDNTELDDAESGQQSHKSLATIEKNGEEYDILRHNMPFGNPSAGEYGTYFVGYSRYLWTIEKMVERMFVGEPPPMHDRLLDFSTPMTGTTFFVPPTSFLEDLDSD